ncbi:MAG: LysR family transcriptional regulator [Ramlibacter sp.]|nr:LysR family transcriptional regulator [Ramlibacter sp.]MCW5648861.1 LysR family transcriptional regulator [Ramlibacter sp.]
MNISQRQLRMFVTTAAQGNISRASESLHISQPALTRALKEFESHIGTVLFERTTRRLALTPEGEQFLPTAQRLLNDLTEAGERLRNQASQMQGTVTLAVGTALGALYLPAVLKTLTARYPDLRLRVVDDNSSGITQRVLHAEADLGIASLSGDTSALICHKLLTAPLGLLANPAHYPLKAWAGASDLARLPLLKEGADTSIMQMLRIHGSSLVTQMEGGVEVSSLSLQLALARAGVGVAVVSALGASHPQAKGMKFVPLRPALRREVFLLQRRDRPLSASARVLRDALMGPLRAPDAHPSIRFERRA